MAMPPIQYAATNNGNRRAVACSVLHSDMLTTAWDDGMLLSAYDIHHRFLADADSLVSDYANSCYTDQKLLIIDSGWYEHHVYRRSMFFDQEPPRPWSMVLYERTIDNLNPGIRPLVVSWDEPNPESYESQIDHTETFFKHRRHTASTILLKPPASTTFHDFQMLRPDLVHTLDLFDVIGVTDDELGDSILDRLVQVAKLRRLLDTAHVQAPIHVFGGLDPLMTPLLFAAGAEIFDGLGWLRYVYRDGLSLNQHSGLLLDGKVHDRGIIALTAAQLRNLVQIQALGDDLRAFALSGGDWSTITNQRHRLGAIFDTFRRTIELAEAEIGGDWNGW